MLLNPTTYLISVLIPLLVGAAIPTFTLWFNSKEKQKDRDYEVKEKLKMVAVEKRLAAHQEAFRFWFVLYGIIHLPDDDKIKDEVIKNITDFWCKNSLYLEDRTRNGFFMAIDIVRNYKKDLLLSTESKSQIEREESILRYKKNWDLFLALVNTIQEEVMLEPIRPKINVDAEGNAISN